MLGSLPTYTTGTGFIVTPVVGLVQPGVVAAARSVRGRRGVRGAAGVADEPGEPPAPRRRGRRRDARVLLDARGTASTPTAARAATSSGARPRRCCATSTASSRPDRARRASCARVCAKGRRYDRAAMSFFAVLFALLLEQVKPLPRGNVVHDALTGWIRGTGAQLRRRQGQPRLGRLVHHRARAGARLRRRSTSAWRRSARCSASPSTSRCST